LVVYEIARRIAIEELVLSKKKEKGVPGTR